MFRMTRSATLSVKNEDPDAFPRGEYEKVIQLSQQQSSPLRNLHLTLFPFLLKENSHYFIGKLYLSLFTHVWKEGL